MLVTAAMYDASHVLLTNAYSYYIGIHVDCGRGEAAVPTQQCRRRALD